MDETETLHMVCESEDGPYVKEEVVDEDEEEYFKQEPIEEENDEEYLETGFLVKQEVQSDDEVVKECNAGSCTMFVADVKQDYDESLYVKIQPKPESQAKSVNAQILQMLKRKQEAAVARRTVPQHIAPRPIKPKPLQPKPTCSTPPPGSPSLPYPHTTCSQDSQTLPPVSNTSASTTDAPGCPSSKAPTPTSRGGSHNVTLGTRRQRKESADDTTPPVRLKVIQIPPKRQRRKKDQDDAFPGPPPPLTVTQVPVNMSATTSQGVLPNISSINQSNPATVPPGALLQVPGLPQGVMLVPVLQGNQLMFMPQAIPGATGQIAAGNATVATGQIAAAGNVTIANGQIAARNATMATGQIAAGNVTMATGQIAARNATMATGQIAAGSVTMANGQIAAMNSGQGNQVMFMPQAVPPGPMTAGQILSQTGMRATGQLMSPTGTMAMGPIVNQMGTLATGQIVGQTGMVATGPIVGQTGTMAAGQIVRQTGTMGAGRIVGQTGTMAAGQIVRQTGTMAAGQIVRPTGMMSVGQTSGMNGQQGNPVMLLPPSIGGRGQFVSQAQGNPVMVLPQGLHQTTNQTAANPFMVIPNNPHVTVATSVSQVGPNPVVVLRGPAVSKPTLQTATSFSATAATPTTQPQTRIIAATPTTRPQTRIIAATPTTQPQTRIIAATPTTEPQTRIIAATPTTQPQTRIIAATPTTQPQTRINAGATCASVPTSQTVPQSNKVATIAAKPPQVGTNRAAVLPVTTALPTSTAQSVTRTSESFTPPAQSQTGESCTTGSSSTSGAMKSLLTLEAVKEACKRRRKSKLIPMEDISSKETHEPVSLLKTVQTSSEEEERKRRRKSELVPKEDISSDKDLELPPKKPPKLPRQILPKPVAVKQTVEEPDPVLNKIMNLPSMFPDTSVADDSKANQVLPPMMIKAFTVPTEFTTSSSSNLPDSSLKSTGPIKTTLLGANAVPAVAVNTLPTGTSTNTQSRKQEQMSPSHALLAKNYFTKRARKFVQQYVKLIMYFDSDFECDLCSQLFETKHHLALHVYEHTDKDINMFLDTAFAASRAFDNGPTERFVCTQCNQEFKRKKYLHRHMKLHAKGRIVISRPQSQTCKKGLINKANIRKMVETIKIDQDFLLRVSMAINDDEKKKGVNLRDLANAILKPLRPPEADDLEPRRVKVVDDRVNQYPDPAAYCCRRCPVVFENFDDLIEHMSLHDEEGVAIATTYEEVGAESEQRLYDNVDPSKSRLLKRIKREPSETVRVTSEDMLQWRRALFNNIATDTEQTYHCVSCSETVEGRTPFLIHLVCHGIFDRGRYYCDKCWDAVFVDYYHLIQHRGQCQENPKQDAVLKCKLCQRMNFKIPDELDKHYREIHKLAFPYVCKLCPFVSSAYLHFANHQELHPESTPLTMFTCLECNEEFETREEYELHDRREHCGRYMGSLFELKHEEVKTSETDNTALNPGSVTVKTPSDGHTGAYRCKECPKTYKNLASYESHVNAYPIGQFKCPRCPKVFAKFCGLQAHRRTHEQQRKNAALRMNLSCKKCGKLFQSSWPSKLKWHEKACRGGSKAAEHSKKMSAALRIWKKSEASGPKVTTAEKVSTFSKDAAENITVATTEGNTPVSGKSLNTIVPTADYATSSLMSQCSGPIVISSTGTKLGEVQQPLPQVIKLQFILTPDVKLTPLISLPSSSDTNMHVGDTKTRVCDDGHMSSGAMAAPDDGGRGSGAMTAPEKRLSSWKNTRKSRKIAAAKKMLTATKRTFKCDQCSKCFARHSTLVSHKAMRHDVYTDEETDCESGEWSEESCHGDEISNMSVPHQEVGEAVPSLNKRYECDQCSRCFTRRSALVSHKATHFNDRTDDDETDEEEYSDHDSDKDVMDPLFQQQEDSSSGLGMEAH